MLFLMLIVETLLCFENSHDPFFDRALSYLASRLGSELEVDVIRVVVGRSATDQHSAELGRASHHADAENRDWGRRIIIIFIRVRRKFRPLQGADVGVGDADTSFAVG